MLKQRHGGIDQHRWQFGRKMRWIESEVKVESAAEGLLCSATLGGTVAGSRMAANERWNQQPKKDFNRRDGETRSRDLSPSTSTSTDLIFLPNCHWC